MKYFSKKSLHDGHHIFFRKSSILGWWEETHLVLIILFSSSLPCFLPPLLPPLLLLFLPFILPSFYYFSHLLFLLILMSYPTLPMWMSSHTVDQIIHYIKFMARWKFEPEIPSMCHLPNKLGLHLPSRASFLNSQKSSLRLVATPPPTSAIGVFRPYLSEVNQSLLTGQWAYRVNIFRYSAILITFVFLYRILSESLSKCLTETS